MNIQIRKEYDRLILQSVSNRNIIPGTVYYDALYFEELKNALARHGVLEAFQGLEFRSYGEERIKICSVASSSRLGFLYGIDNGICNFEITDISNSICKPHFDSSEGRIFFEYKCHEFTEATSEHNCISDSYCELLKRHFKVELNGSNNLVQSFHIPLGNQENLCFDFKQLICHLIGLFSIATKENKVTLQYLMFTPAIDDQGNLKNGSQKLKSWYANLQNEIKRIFSHLNEMDVEMCNREHGKLKEFVSLTIAYIEASSVPDIVIEKI